MQENHPSSDACVEKEVFNLAQNQPTTLMTQVLNHSIQQSTNTSIFPLYMACLVESSTVETSDGIKLHTRVFKPKEEIKDNLVVVLVHPFSLLGGCQALLKGIALGLAERGYRAVTFDTRGAGRSTGRASLTGFSEVKDVVAVCKWASENLSSDRILLVGSSAGMEISLFM